MQELNYIRCGDYYIPDIRLPEENRPIGRWGRMHKEYLREHNPIRFDDLYLSEKLWTYLADLNEQAQNRLELIIEHILKYRQHFIAVMERQLKLESTEKLQISRKQLERNERRISELKRLFIKIYEDNAKGKLSDERFDMMSQSYETEQKQLEAEVISLRQEIEVQERQNENIEKFIRKADKYVGIEKIDPAMLRELIKAIYVEAPDKSSGKRRQNIHIQYDGIGFIPLDELMNQKETA